MDANANTNYVSINCTQQSSHGSQTNQMTATQPYVRIVEQPAKCALRFRYECEGRSAGSIPGCSATADSKTYPTIQVCNFRGSAVVVVSCVTKEQPYRPHPHNLVGKEGCKKGVCTMVIGNPDMMCSFTSLGIQCVKRKDIEDSLKLRESIKVDPYRTGFSHKSQSSNIDLNVVRLCFQVFIEGAEKEKYTVQLPPIVSDPIYDKKAMTELTITKLSHCSAPCCGGNEVILLCDRVTKDDIQVRFFQEVNGQLIWDAMADLQPSDVHKQVAICFRTPRYYNDNISQPITVQLQLRRPSDGCTSDPRAFQLLPREVDPDGLTRKRQKIEEGCLERFLRENNIIAGSNTSSPLTAKREVIHVPRMAANIKIEPLSNPQTTLQSLVGPTPSQSTSWSSQQQFIRIPQPSVQQTFQQRPQMDVLLCQSNYNQRTMSQLSQGSPQQSQSQSEYIIPNSQPISQQNQKSFVTLSPMNPLLQALESHHMDNCNASAINNHNIVNNINNLNTTDNNTSNGITEEVMVKFDSLGLDIDSSELLGDMNFNSMTIMSVIMDSDNNLNLSALNSGTLQTPQPIDISNGDESTRNLMDSPSQMQRLHNKLMQLEGNDNQRI